MLLYCSFCRLWGEGVVGGGGRAGGWGGVTFSWMVDIKLSRFHSLFKHFRFCMYSLVFKII